MGGNNKNRWIVAPKAVATATAVVDDGLDATTKRWQIVAAKTEVTSIAAVKAVVVADG